MAKERDQRLVALIAAAPVNQYAARHLERTTRCDRRLRQQLIGRRVVMAKGCSVALRVVFCRVKGCFWFACRVFRASIA